MEKAKGRDDLELTHAVDHDICTTSWKHKSTIVVVSGASERVLTSLKPLAWQGLTGLDVRMDNEAHFHAHLCFTDTRVAFFLDVEKQEASMSDICILTASNNHQVSLGDVQSRDGPSLAMFDEPVVAVFLCGSVVSIISKAKVFIDADALVILRRLKSKFSERDADERNRAIPRALVSEHLQGFRQSPCRRNDEMTVDGHDCTIFELVDKGSKIWGVRRNRSSQLERASIVQRTGWDQLAEGSVRGPEEHDSGRCDHISRGRMMFCTADKDFSLDMHCLYMWKTWARINLLTCTKV
ncbi:hypothetical protein BCR37DRAFT_250304 [Protomyces lactucae-debilis]|uniref:Uncharacterized protein n=1 Tax=Protomyces lactucae-debilis TaxID=2754530 RepID=A0A1Y2FLB2_PROLT|nr:uncharacterized protein BCR37DRAFT_250304 [Protomyces lactucae-debilis]ORY84760.1 hypothetical protein BCR37DRAFT_250304 [Protomyces lactucae-debilis]